MDPDPFTEALRPHYEDAARYAAALCSDGAVDPDDLLQESILKALRGFEGLRERQKFRPWLFTIITRTHRSLLRRSFWSRAIPLGRSLRDDRTPQVFIEEDTGAEDRVALHRALQGLSDESRAVLLLFELGGFSVEEIRRMRDYQSLSAVKSRLSRARRRLAEALEPANDTRRTDCAPDTPESNGGRYDAGIAFLG